MAEPLLALQGIRRSFGSGSVATEVLHGIDLQIGRGEFVALTGPSGSGKSTLLQIVGLLDRPSAGTMRLDGVPTVGLDDDGRTSLRGRAIGFVFQFHHLLPEFTALENVVMPMVAVEGRTRAGQRERGLELLGSVGLADRAEEWATNLSGGQQQRVAVARALALDPPLVLADEPTGNLDTATGEQVFALLRRIHRERGTAFLVVTHDLDIAERCDRVVDLVDGQVRFDRPGRAAGR